MGLIYFLLGVIAALLMLVSIRCLFKRVKCLFSLRRVCRRHGFVLRRTHPLWFLGSRYFKGSDCLIETPGAVFGVKFFGCFWPLKSLIFRERGEYFFRAHSAFFAPLLEIFDGYPHTLPEYRFPKEEDRKVRRILLINPMPMEIRFQPSSGLESISGTGDMLRGMEIASLSHLTRLLDNAAIFQG